MCSVHTFAADRGPVQDTSQHDKTGNCCFLSRVVFSDSEQSIMCVAVERPGNVEHIEQPKAPKNPNAKKTAAGRRKAHATGAAGLAVTSQVAGIVS
jgi:hypothetical protein